MKNLKPFDLQAALGGKAVMLRDGRKAYVRHHETELKIANSMRLIGFSAEGYRLTWCEDGSYSSPSETSCRDIIGMYPEARIINGFEVPAPQTQTPKYDSHYYVSSVNDRDLYMEHVWYGDIYDFRMLERGLVFLNAEDATAKAKAMLGIDPNSETES